MGNVEIWTACPALLGPIRFIERLSMNRPFVLVLERMAWLRGRGGGGRARGRTGSAPGHCRGGSGSARKDALHFLRKLLQTFRAVGARLFRDAPTFITNVVERLHHRRPVIVAFQKLDAKAFPEALLDGLLAAEFLDVQFLNAFAEDVNPLLGPAVGNDVAHVEMPADPRTVELVHVTRRLERAEKKMVPDIFDGDLHPEFLRQRNGFADFL